MTVTLSLDSLPTDSSARRALSDLSLSVAKCKRILVVTGAGISCSCGIPDFRSSDGLYNLVKQKYPDVVLKGRDLFDASLFRDATSTSVFYTFISQLKQSIDAVSPAPTHRFIKTLDAKKKLLRSYTQNIDGLEARAGLLGSSSHEAKAKGKGKAKIDAKGVRNVQLHGDIHRVRCRTCSADYPCSPEHVSMFNTGMAPDCPECSERSRAREARSARPLKVGTLRPAIVLYDEPHPLGDDIGAMQCTDAARRPDMLIIMGTSLKVHGLKKLVKDFARAVHASAPPEPSARNAKTWAGKVVFVNRTPPGSEWAGVIDYHVASDTDAWVDKVVEDWKRMWPADWEVQQTLVASGDVGIGGSFKTVKERILPGTKTKAKVAAKKPRLSENKPPEDVFLVSGEFSSAPSGKPVLPPSPSKRRQATSHYCNVESSPSKKRLSRTNKSALEPEERGLLFGDSTNHRSANVEVAKGGQDIVVSPSKLERRLGRTRSQTLQAKKEVVVRKKRTISLERKTDSMWVEIGPRTQK